MTGNVPADVDLLIVNGRAYTPDGFTDAAVGFRDGRIAFVGHRAESPKPRDIVDADGGLVVPGLIDLHTHVYLGSARLGVNPDKTAARSGVTTWVDAGTSGAGTFEGLLMHVRDRSRARVVPFLNMSYIGLAPAGMLTREIGELWDPAFADLRAVLRTAEEFPGEIKGIKVRASSNALGDNAAVVLPQAREAADELGVPLMIHIGMAPPTLIEVLPYLRAGDLLTHCFHPHAGGRIIGADGRVRPEVHEAVARGVLMDVGHGVASMSHRVAIQGLDEGILPDSLSSDLHAENVGGPVQSMLTVMEMFLALGMALDEVLDRSTRRPATAISRPDLGRLEPGAAGDAAVLALEPTDRSKQDSTGHRIQLNQRFVHRLTVVGGDILAPFEDGRNEFRSSPWLSKFGATENDDH